jgi:hypothetical protein
MIPPLTPKQRALAQAMGEISERAYSASWIDRLEFLLWHLLTANKKKIGRVMLTELEKSALRSLSSECGGWIIFDDIEEEEFVALPRWQELYAEWFAANSQFLKDGS